MLKKIKAGFAKLFTKEKKDVNKLLYCILVIIGGRFGIHKFYARKIGMGIVYLLLCLTPVSIILSYVDFAKAIVQKRNDKKRILA